MMSDLLKTTFPRRTVLRTSLMAGFGAASGLSTTAFGARPARRTTSKPELAYVCRSLDDTVSVIDVATNRVIQNVHLDYGEKITIPRWPTGAPTQVSNAPMNAIFSPDRKQVWVPCSKGRNIAIIDVATNTIAKKIDLVMDPNEIAFTPDGRSVVSSLITRDFKSLGAVTIIDVATGIPSAPIMIGTNPEELVVTLDGKRAYVMSKSLWVIDIEKREIEREIHVPYAGYDLISSPDGRFIYISCAYEADKIMIIENHVDPSKIAVAGTIDADCPTGMAFSRDNSCLFVTSNKNGLVQMIDMATKRITKTGKVAEMPAVIALTMKGDRAYVAHNIGVNVSVIDTETLEVVATIATGDQPNSVAVGIAG